MVQEREISMRDHDHGGMHTVLTSYSLRIVFLPTRTPRTSIRAPPVGGPFTGTVTYRGQRTLLFENPTPCARRD